MDEIFCKIKQIAVDIAQEIKYSDFGYTDGKNKTGDTQLKLDVKSDMIITNHLLDITSIKAIVSEEKDEIFMVNKEAKFIVAYDPLDGSSLVDVNFSIGSIFAIYEDEILPSNLVASAYIIYGPRIEIVICKEVPQLFRFDKDNNLYFVRELKLDDRGKLNSPGATQKYWSQEHEQFIKDLFSEGYRLRYSGAMVSDLHQILIKGGGLFSYPTTKDAPMGKLRVCFEILPFAYIFEKAGGMASDGKNATLFNIKIEKIHQTSPCYFGSKYEIKKLIKQ